ncbi:MAG: transposase [Candidatus Aureabacteria bacterium]|nr:transposase [Candidatus Auribacterota bacterium]
MARPLRIIYPGAWYHVTCRGNEKATIFRDDGDRRKFLKILEESVSEFGVEVHCYVMMINHFHLLLRTQLGNLNRFMQKFNTAYITYFNRRHARTGHLYQGRYKAILIDADNYLLELSRYVHLNPVRVAKLEKATLEQKIAILKNYPWSSYRTYLGIEPTLYLHDEVILGMIGPKGKRCRKSYESFVLQALRKGVRNPLDEKKARSVLGGDEFLKWVYEDHLKGMEEDKEYRAKAEGRRQTARTFGESRKDSPTRINCIIVKV